ncbi:SDR family NAD(P)-dependent oxidoreductase [Amorphus orientalis]|uniref:NAD(P)-dependent dehydrogenase (Short-subunit alcohol dehydrogenase family) n=1 Tax=Amorphus orientalis TaxID=649198 RepID=A0AAE3VPY7_9HYPH|nr:SDR family NAD(P)-dependent oxidoreductase [Amorphus orientalis]MDQ0315606.1 NAD(P)-dependent dehydrogenase (short-subunit alcohol dehydrogenase family) [Amorphus orientalis]
MAGSFAGRVAVVTGATRGIGWSVAEALGAAGAHVVAVGRTVGALEELDDAIQAKGGESATLVPIDVTDYDALDRLGGAIYERFGRLDILVGNAGMLGQLSPMGHIPPKVWDQVIGTNLTANWRLIRSLDPLLRQSEAGRAVFLTSDHAHTAEPFWGALAASKAGLDALVKTYANEIAHTSVRANLVDPGPTRTQFRARAYPGEDPETVAPPSGHAQAILALLTPECDANGETISLARKMADDGVLPSQRTIGLA